MPDESLQLCCSVMSVGEARAQATILSGKRLRFDEIVRADCKTQSNFFKLCLRQHASCCIIHTEIHVLYNLPVHCLLESIMQQFEEMSPSGTERSAWHISLLLKYIYYLHRTYSSFLSSLTVYWPYQFKK